MKRSYLLFLFLFFVCAGASRAAYANMLDYPSVKLQALDKITARTITFEGKVGTTLKFASIYIKIQTCQKPPAYERSDAAAFLQIWEVTPQDESKWIFSGWMFAASPAVSAMDHPIYDVWVVDCLGTPLGGDTNMPPPEAAEDIDDEEVSAPDASAPAPAPTPATDETGALPTQTPSDPAAQPESNDQPQDSPLGDEKPAAEEVH